MPKLTPAQMKKAIEAYNKVSLNIGRNVGDKVNSLTDKEIEAAIMSRFPGARIDSHKVIPAQPNTKFGPFEPTSQVTMQANPGSLESQLHSLSQDLQQQAIPGINHTTGTGVLSGPGAADWGGKFDKGYFVHPGDTTAFGNRQEDFKKQFTGGFYHGSPSPDIKAFDSLKSPKGPEKVTPGVTFAARNPDFANSLLPDTFDEATNTMVHPFTPGSTVYPISINMSNHFDPKTKEGQAVLADFVKQRYLSGENPDKKAAAKFLMNISDPHSNWTTMEGTDFLDHLKSTGHKSFEVRESGFKNVGVFDPSDIRGKFADYNPEFADSPEFMKAEGGAVEGYAPGGKVVRSGLAELIDLIKNKRGPISAQRLERAADLVPNLEHHYQPEALKEVFGSGKSSGIVVMDPSKFQEYAAPLTKSQKASTKGYKIGEPSANSGYANVPWVGFDEKMKHLQGLVDPQTGTGFSSVPFLQVANEDKRLLPQIHGHEGRHRTEALSRLGDKSTIVQLRPVGELKGETIGDSYEEFLNKFNRKVGNPALIRPELYTNPDNPIETIQRSSIDLPEMFAAGGNVAKAAKKALEHARSMPVLHYSKQPNLTELDPRFYGSKEGIKGQEARRLKGAQDIRDRSYFYVDAGEDTMKPEQGLGPFKYQGTAHNIYDLANDPAGYGAIARQKALDPYMLEHGREMVDPELHANELERAIKGAGYSGYSNDKVGLTWEPLPVIRSE